MTYEQALNCNLNTTVYYANRGLLEVGKTAIREISHSMYGDDVVWFTLENYYDCDADTNQVSHCSVYLTPEEAVQELHGVVKKRYEEACTNLSDFERQFGIAK